MKFIIMMVLIAAAAAENRTTSERELVLRAMIISDDNFRADQRCGWGYPAPNGSPFSKCNPNGIRHCCSERGWCGSGPDFCNCKGCVNFANYRDDKRCGPGYPAPSGNRISECDPGGGGPTPCCSIHGWCGIGEDYCNCDGCISYQQFEKYREDHRCGANFPAPNGDSSSECNPDGGSPCCSTHGWCGIGGDYCDCYGCVNYKPSYRDDGHCGPQYSAPNNNWYSTCNPKGIAPCCSPHGWCGNSGEHCYCNECIYYK